mmetsp:Transcript_8210/g.14074  ORF Transcript_8210/g.14074 Transcript_8210/m.14074 type:complete len:304 (-) Transcript_8210:548-1459(-)
MAQGDARHASVSQQAHVALYSGILVHSTPAWSQTLTETEASSMWEARAAAPVSAGFARPVIFRSSGLHDLTGGPRITTPAAEPHVPSSRRIAGMTSRPVLQQAWQSRAELQLEVSLQTGRATYGGGPLAAQDSFPAPAMLLQDNMGYRLLQSAGWREGTGLGALEQGITKPIEATRNPGTKGIGFSQTQSGVSHEAVQKQRRQQPADIGAAEPPPGTKRARIQAMVDEELAGESLETKLKHHRAAAHAEQEQKRGQDIHRMLCAAFDDPLDNAGATTANSNVLGRNTRLTATNPLLGSEGDSD